MPDPVPQVPPKIETVGIISKPHSPQAARVVPELVEWLQKRGVTARVDPETADYAKRAGGSLEGVTREEVAQKTHLIIVLGGDGTLLSAARALGGREIPIFAVNLGNLGFLTAIPVDDLYFQLECVFKGEYRIVPRRMLHSELWRAGERIAAYESLNDVTMAKIEMARIIDLEVHVDDRFMCVYKADGLIISTPTGSTAYSLSAGGPIVFPTVGAFCITPICPHMLTNRPIIVPDESVIEVTLPTHGVTTYLTIDGQVGETLRQGDRVVCRRSEHRANLIYPPSLSFFDVLREKLNWGGR